MNKKNILGVGITDASEKEVLEYIIKNLENFTEKSYFVTPNPEFLVLANKNITFKNILNNADLALADGVGVMIAAKILGKPLRDRFTGVDLVKNLCEVVSEKPITVGFLGGRGGVAELTAECLRKKYPKLKVGFVGEEWPNEKLSDSTHSLKDSSKPSGNTSLIHEDGSHPTAENFYQKSLGDSVKNSFREEYRQSDRLPRHKLTVKYASQKVSCSDHTPSAMRHLPIDILFVAYGAPKQEFWISKNLPKIPVKIAIGVGGAFDYISGKIPRAPGFLRNFGLEWLFRLIVQPWRIKRQLSLFEFIYLVLKERMSQ